MAWLDPSDDLDRVLAEMGPVEAAAYRDATRRMLLLRELVAWRKQVRLSQQTVAATMDTTQSAVSELEGGRGEPRLSTLQRYARAVGRELSVGLVADENEFASAAAAEALARDVLPAVVDGSLGQVLTVLLREHQAHGARSSDQLAEQTGLPESTVDRAVHRLNATGWVRMVSDPAEPISVVALNPERALIVGVSMHQDHAQGIITDLRAENVYAIRRCELHSTNPKDAVATVASLVSKLVEAGSDGREVIGLGVELAGVVRDDLGIVSYAPDLESRSQLWHSEPLQAELQNATGLPTVLENDTNALAVHEYLRRGDTSDLAVVLLSEDGGIGCGLVHEGRLLRGAGGVSGEIGHVVVDPGGRPCRHAEQRGCLETVASVTVIAAEVELARARGETGLDVYRAAGGSLGDVLATLTSIVALPLMVIYGPAALTDEKLDSARVFNDAVRDHLDRAWFTHYGMKPNVETRVLQSTAGARGAASVAISHFLHRPLRWLSELSAPTGTSARPTAGCM